MRKKYFKALSVATIATMLTTIAAPAFAANGDFYDKTNNVPYNAMDYRTNATAFNALLSALDARPGEFVFENGGQGYNYDKMLTAIYAGIEDGLSVTDAFLAAKADPTNEEEMPTDVATVSSVSAINVTTVAGTAPVLPATGTATMSDATTKDVAITWAAVDAASYAAAGTFTVEGTIAESATVKATATVTVTAEAVATTIASVSALNAKAETVAFAETNMIPVNSIVLTGSAALDAATVTTANVTITKVDGNVAQAGTVAYDAATKNITFTLAANAVFANSTEFKINVAGVKDSTGAAVTYTKNFTTGNQLVVSRVRPVGTTGNASGTAYELDVNKTMDAATVTTTSVKLFNVTDGVYLADANGIVYDAATNRISFDTGVALTANKDYRFDVKAAVAALDGATMGSDQSFTFSSFGAFTAVGKTALIGTDARIWAAGPTVVNGNLTAIKDGTKLGFSYKLMTATDLDPTTVTSSNVYLQQADTLATVDSTVTYADKIITITPKANLTQEKTYNVVIKTGVKTAKGIAVAAEEVSDEFTTRDYTQPTVESASVSNGSLVSGGDILYYTFSELMDVSGFVFANAAGTYHDGANAGAATMKVRNLTTNADIDATAWVRSITTTADNKTKVGITVPAAITKGNTYRLTFKGYVAAATTGAGRNVADDTVDQTANTELEDNVLAADYTFDFTVPGADSTGPKVLSILGDDGLALNNQTNVKPNEKFQVQYDDKNIVINDVINQLADVSALATSDVTASDDKREEALVAGTTTVPTLGSTAGFYVGDKVQVLDLSTNTVVGAETTADAVVTANAAANLLVNDYVAFAANAAAVNEGQIYKITNIAGAVLTLDRNLETGLAGGEQVILVQPRTLVALTANTDITVDSALRIAPAGNETVRKVRAWFTGTSANVLNIVHDVPAASAGTRTLSIANAQVKNADGVAGNTTDNATYKVGVGPKWSAFSAPAADQGALAAVSSNIVFKVVAEAGDGTNADAVAAASLNDSTIVLEKQDGTTWTKFPAYALTQGDDDAGGGDAGVITITLDPTGNLAASSTYRVTVNSGLKDTKGNMFQVGDNIGSFSFIAKTPDTTAPTAPTFTGATEGVVSDTQPTITITFAEKVAKDGALGSATPQTMDNTVIKLVTAADYSANGEAATNIAYTLKGDGTTAAATGATVYTIKPDAPLTKGVAYKVLVIGDGIASNGTGVADMTNNALDATAVYDFSISTTSSDTTAPAFYSASIFLDADGTFPTAAVATNETAPGSKTYTQAGDGTDFIGLAFDEAVDVSTATVTVTNISAVPAAAVGTLPIIAVADVDATGTTRPGLVIKFGGVVQAKTYKIDVAGVKDATGNVTTGFSIYLSGNTD